ncbi:MAG: hypothetical protein B7Z31_09880 [Rhodobacterales bacterium 12-65-15]|nr:MAG: hypothetical protein B7Z31_09880 [Rhodobacterales bacterium 12-65-15]
MAALRADVPEASPSKPKHRQHAVDRTFAGSDLSGADLSGADLSGADLSRASRQKLAVWDGPVGTDLSGRTCRGGPVGADRTRQGQTRQGLAVSAGLSAPGQLPEGSVASGLTGAGVAGPPRRSWPDQARPQTPPARLANRCRSPKTRRCRGCSP